MALPTPKNWELQRRVIAGLLAHSHLWHETEISEFLKDEDFYAEQNNQVDLTLFRVCRSLLEEGKQLDPVIVASRCKDHRVSFEKGDIIDLIDNLSIAPPKPEAFIDAVKELKMTTIKRNYFESYKEAAQYVHTYKGNSLAELVKELDAIINKDTSDFLNNKEVINVFEDAQFLIEDAAANPRDNLGFNTHIEHWNTLYGGLPIGEGTLICARKGSGKSALLADTAFHICNQIDQSSITGGQSKVPCLFIDTELSRQQVTFRLVAQIADVDYWYLRTGNWSKNKEMADRVRASYALLKDFQFHHIFVGNADVDEINSIIKRWVLKNVGRDKYFVVCWDYIKPAKNKRNGMQEHEMIGDMFDRTKDLIKNTFPKGALLGAIQSNREGVNGRYGPADDDSAVSLSDRLSWYAAQMFILRKKTLEELQDEPIDHFGSRKLINLKTRESGRQHRDNDFVQIRKKYVPNWINLKYGHYCFRDAGDGYAVKGYMDLQEQDHHDDDSGDIL